MQWVREESLASIQVAEFVELPENVRHADGERLRSPQIVLVTQRRADNVSEISLLARMHVDVISVPRQHHAISRKCTDGGRRQRGGRIYS
jgi:hypothetical protein